MRITKVIIRHFKRFEEDVTFDLDNIVVVAGPNNCGKTTLLQAIASWSLVLDHWCTLNNYRQHRGAYARAPIARQAFYAVPVRTFDLLWHKREHKSHIEIELTCDGDTLAVEIQNDSSEQIYARPRNDVPPHLLKQLRRKNTLLFVPAMTALGTEEPVYQSPKIKELLGQGKSGDVLRNLLAEAHRDDTAWEQLTRSIQKMFGYELLPPNTDGPNIIAEYRHQPNGARYDIASAGSGFLQVLMLLTFLHSRKGTVLLLDEPDAHLHVILQDVIYSELRAAAHKNNSQLIIATHSEIVINAVDPRELCAMLGRPRKLANDAERAQLIRSLSYLSNTDILLAMEKKNILYVEGHTDLDLLRTWATILNHPILSFLEHPFWKPTVSEARLHAKGVKAQDHFESLRMAEPEIRGVQVSDRDGNEHIPASKLTLDDTLLKLCWTRYEIENYLVHPAVLARCIEKTVGPHAPLSNVDAMREAMRKHLPGAVVDDPMRNHDVLVSTKMRKSIVPEILNNAGLIDYPYTRYAEIAAVMHPEEIHPDIPDTLTVIANHFRL